MKDLRESVENLGKLINEAKTEATEFINLTPHPIKVHVGSEVVTFPPSGKVARVDNKISKNGTVGYEGNTIPKYKKKIGSPSGIPSPKKGVYYIVSAMVFDATDRKDVVAPTTDLAKRNDKGWIESVPGFTFH